MSKGRKFTLEFKQEAVKLVTDQGYTQAEASRSLGVSSKNINRWVLDLNRDESQSNSKKLTIEQEELHRLRKENKQLKMEHEILKKAAAFFARESS
jgi:transposase